MAYDKTNTGILSRNERKESDKHPDFKGALNIEGVEYWLSGWVQERKDGTGKFFSLKVNRKDAQQPQQAKPAQTPANGFENYDPMRDDIPF